MAEATSASVANGLSYKPQHEWGWQVALDLYLAGLGSGSLVIGLLMYWLGYSPYSSQAILLWGPLAIAAGASFLILKLGIKRRFLNTVMNPRTSWLSRGFYILSACIIFGMVILGISLLPLFGINTDRLLPVTSILNVLVFVFAGGAAIYTGILIRSVKFVSLWNTYLLPALFTISSATTGTLATILVTVTWDMVTNNPGYSSHMTRVLTNTAAVLMLAEGIVLILYLNNRYRAFEGQARNSIILLLSGKLKLVFWLGTVVTGFMLPAGLGIVYSIFPEHSYILPAAAALALTGRLCLRLGIVYAGIKDQTPWAKFVELQQFLKYPNTSPILLPTV